MCLAGMGLAMKFKNELVLDFFFPCFPENVTTILNLNSNALSSLSDFSRISHDGTIFWPALPGDCVMGLQDAEGARW